MRFMFIMQSDAEAMPPPELIAAMHEMAQREVAAGRMISDGGLAPAAAGKRMRLKSRKLMVTDGPFAETKEIIGGFAIFELPDMAAAEESARQFMSLHLAHMPDWEGVCEIRQIAGSQVEMIRGGA
ncbi:MAG: hypothetical protein JSR98_04555 [Proteobacteria bacterium]|nr:hypothetical protein [Pseudomonadota bacterium]